MDNQTPETPVVVQPEPQRGMPKRALIALIVLVLAGAAGGAYALYKRNQDKKNNADTVVIDGKEYPKTLTGQGTNLGSEEEAKTLEEKNQQDLEAKLPSGEVTHDEYLALAQEAVMDNQLEKAIEYYELAKSAIPQNYPDRDAFIKTIEGFIEYCRTELEKQ